MGNERMMHFWDCYHCKISQLWQGVLNFWWRRHIGWSTKYDDKGAISFQPSEIRCILHGCFCHNEHPSAEHRVPVMKKHSGIETQILPMTTCLILTPSLDLGPSGSCFLLMVVFLHGLLIAKFPKIRWLENAWINGPYWCRDWSMEARPDPLKTLLPCNVWHTSSRRFIWDSPHFLSGTHFDFPC